MAALRVHQREGGIVADGADVAEVIGQSLEFRHQRAQPHRAFRNLDPVRRFDRTGVGERVGNGAVAGNAAGEDRHPINGHSRHQPLDSLVRVTESRLETHDRFAVRGEPEMARLDDPRMDRTYRDLMQARPDCREEGITAGDFFRLGWRARAFAMPRSVIEPRARVGKSLRLQSPEVANRPFQAQRGWMRFSDRRIALSRAFDADHAEISGAIVRQRYVHVVVIGPEPEQRPFAAGQDDRRRSPGFVGHDRAWPWTVVRGDPACGEDVAQFRLGCKFVAHLMSLVAMHYNARPHPFPLSQDWARGNVAVQMAVTHLHDFTNATDPRRVETTPPMPVADRCPRPGPAPDA